MNTLKSIFLQCRVFMGTIIAIIAISSPASAETPASAEAMIAYFAGGCFWCTESDYEKIQGVKSVVSGFMGGSEKSPAYIDVAKGRTKHRETVQVIFDPNVVSYQELLSAFWRMHDPSDAGGSFSDRGRQYGSAIYPVNATQTALAKGAIAALNASKKFDRSIATQIEPAGPFYPAAASHQDYYKKSARRYKYYRYRSGRDQFLEKVWKGDTTLYQKKS